MAKSRSLIPPDPTRCQAEFMQGSFMTLGPRSLWRCENKPVCIVREKKPNPIDGLKGSMSLCEECLARMKTKLGDNYATIRML